MQQIDYSNYSLGISSTIAAIFSLIGVVFLIYLAFFIRNYWNTKIDRDPQKYKSLTEEMRHGMMALQYRTVFLLKRLLMSIAIVILTNYPSLQIALMILSSVLSMSYLLQLKPYESNLLLRLEVFNEISVLAILYHLFLFTAYIDNLELLEYLGYNLIAITAINLLVNITFVFINLISSVITVMRKIKNSKIIRMLMKRFSNKQQIKISMKQKQIQIVKNTFGDFTLDTSIDYLSNIHPKITLRKVSKEHFDPKDENHQNKQQQSLNANQHSIFQQDSFKTDEGHNGQKQSSDDEDSIEQIDMQANHEDIIESYNIEETSFNNGLDAFKAQIQQQMGQYEFQKYKYYNHY